MSRLVNWALVMLEWAVQIRSYHHFQAAAQASRDKGAFFEKKGRGKVANGDPGRAVRNFEVLAGFLGNPGGVVVGGGDKGSEIGPWAVEPIPPADSCRTDDVRPVARTDLG